MIKIAVISHTEHYYAQNGEIVGWEPTIREINHFPEIFDLTYHVAPLYSNIPHEATAPYRSDRIKYIPIRPSGGKGIIKKLGILFHLPFNLIRIINTINKVDWVHFRAPTNLGLFILPLLTLYGNKKMWIKYAGNWKQKKIPLSYSLQRWWLRNNFNRSIVTINGRWENQKPHLLSFPNPCIDDKELHQAAKMGSQKDFSDKLILCFVGRIDNNKGMLKIIEAVNNCGTLRRIKEINIAGGGTDSLLTSNLNTNNIIINYLGWVNRSKLNNIYEKSHIIILPTQSEGFPKVIAEAVAYGCIPIVTNIPPINQFVIQNKNGLLLNTPSVSEIKECLIQIDQGEYDLKKISEQVIKLANTFTYSHYIDRIQSEIINV